MNIQNTLTPYEVVEYHGIQYGVCRDFDHISRYRGLRQVTHVADTPNRFVTLETPNPFQTHSTVLYYEVLPSEENRLDLIAYKLFGDPTYSWILAYFNQIGDGYSVRSGQKLIYPKSITDLFNKGEMLAAVSPMMLNLGEE